MAKNMIKFNSEKLRHKWGSQVQQERLLVGIGIFAQFEESVEGMSNEKAGGIKYGAFFQDFLDTFTFEMGLFVFFGGRQVGDKSSGFLFLMKK